MFSDDTDLGQTSRPSGSLDAVHDDDLEQLLEDLGELGRFERGDAKCAFCRDVITRANLHVIFPGGGQVKYSCDRPVCVIKLFELAGDPARG